MGKKKVFKVKKTGQEEVIYDRREFLSLHFPQISRFFNARYFCDLFLGFLIFSVFGILAFNYLYPVDSFEKARVNLFLRPSDPKSYILLSDLYLSINDTVSAKQELNNALFFSGSNVEKAEITRKILEIEKKERSKEDVEAEILKWEKIASQKPDYRDAFFRLAVLNYQIYKSGQAREFLDKAMALDPNFEEGKRLRELL